MPPTVARHHNSRKSSPRFPEEKRHPKEIVAPPLRPPRSAGGDSRGTVLFRTDERGLMMSSTMPIPIPKTPAPAQARGPPPVPTVPPRTHPGPLFYEFLATIPPQPPQNQPLPRAARRDSRARKLSVFIIVSDPWLNSPLG